MEGHGAASLIHHPGLYWWERRSARLRLARMDRQGDAYVICPWLCWLKRRRARQRACANGEARYRPLS